jgi:hypothetical protein
MMTYSHVHFLKKEYICIFAVIIPFCTIAFVLIGIAGKA